MKRNKALCGILTVLATCLLAGCSMMQAKNDLVLDPHGATAFERALDYEEQQEFDLASAEYQAAIVADPTDSRPWVNLGLIHHRAGRTRAAIACWQKAVHANPNDAYAYNLLGNVWKAQGDYAKAAAYYRRAIAADPDYADPHWNMAAACRHLGREREAAEEYAAFIEVAKASDTDDVSRARTYLAELGGKDFTPRPRMIPGLPAVAEDETAGGEDATVDIVVLDPAEATLRVGDEIKFSETEATPEDPGETVDADDATPDDVIDAPDDADDIPTDAADEAPDADTVEDEKAKAAAELERAVLESTRQVRAEE